MTLAQSTSAANDAFIQLATALNAEAAELRRIGSEHFHGGFPKESQGVLRRSVERARLREQICRLHEQWQTGSQVTKEAAPPSAEVGPRVEPTNPVLLRHIKGMSVPDAAAALGLAKPK